MGLFGMKCERCGSHLKEGESYDFHEKILCEDCCMYETNPPKACDPMAVSAALSIRKQLGQSGIDGLTELQKTICNTIEARGKITREELAKIVSLKPEELDQQFAILCHCELARALKEAGKVYLTKW
jgi:Glu-tRNA(Gln) amidotransferase subunit E-like FAD-binding protein